MNTSRATWICAALALGIASLAKAEKKNPPKNSKIVLEMLAEAGPEHMPEKMKPSKLGSIKMGDTYYHVFTAEPKDMDFRIIIFDNHDKYLGYYESEFEAVDYETGAILLDPGDSDFDFGSGSEYFRIKLGEKGISDRVNLEDGSMLTLVKPAEKSAAPVAMTTTTGESIVPEYRTWNITRKGTLITVRAIFVRMEPGKIIIRDEKRGRETPILLNELSKEDQAYVKQFKK